MRVKEIISVCMLFLIISHGIIQFVIFKVFQAKYRTEIVEMMLNDLSEIELVSFKFDKQKFLTGSIRLQWIEEDEFRYNNKMYDVVKKELHSNYVNFYCIEDENESLLYSYFDKYFQKLINEDPVKEEDLEGFSISLSQFYSKPFEFECNPRDYFNGEYSIVYNSNLLDGIQFSITPPPRS